MKRSVILVNVAAAMALSAQAAMAADIVKCVAPDGGVTLTDLPCPAGAATVRLEQDHAAPTPPGPPMQRRVAPAAVLHQRTWRRPDLSRPMPLKRDVATLKAAHRALLMLDAKPSLAAD